MQHRDKIILEKVIAEAEIGISMLSGTSFEDFEKDEVLKRAVAMTAINIGELIKSVTDEMRKEHPEVQWKAAAGLRDVAAHKYQTLRMDDVFNTAKEDFPVLKNQLESILKSEE